MQTVLNPNIKMGTFRRELKNRFLCEVDIDGESTVCYVPSSCHLSNFLSLKGKRVLLLPTKSENTRTQYALFAVPHKKNYIILNSSMANHAIEKSICSRRFAFLGKRTHVAKEYRVNDYKSDLFIEDTNTIIEIKSILSVEKIAQFPTVYSERALEQFEKLLELLKQGYKVHYFIVSLSPYVSDIHIIGNTSFAKLLIRCIENGMLLSAFTCRLKESQIIIDKRINVYIE